MTKEAIRVRNVARTDFDQWLPLWEGYNAFYERVGPKAVPMEVTRTTCPVSSITTSRYIVWSPRMPLALSELSISSSTAIHR